ncbi:MAG: phage tail family protein [Chloroflexi bacterium]|nr:phage tail family protein [Chloroflexota bacterium]
MGLFEIVTPLATTNLGENPSLETDTTKWSAVGASAAIARDNTQARFGRYSIKITSGTDVLSGGYYYTAGAGITVASSTAHAVAFYVFNATRAMRLSARDQAGTELAVTSVTASTKWKRVKLAFTTGGSSTTVHFRFTNDNNTTTHVFYVDAVLVEVQSTSTTYADGDQPGCFWDGVEHASTSQREAFGVGGQIRDMESLATGVRVSRATGMGMPALKVNQQPFAKLPGSVFQDVKVGSRVANIVFLADGTSIANLHVLRQALVDAIKPDRVSEPSHVRLTYTAAVTEVYADFIYEGGLEEGARMGFTETLAMRLLATDPFWREDAQEAVLPSFTQTLTPTRVMRRQRGEWGFDGTGANNNVLAISGAPDGSVYFGGAFTDFDGATNTKRAAKLKGSTISALNGGIDNGQVNAIAIAPDGTVYLGGTFTAVNSGTTVNRIVKYNPSANSFSTMGATPGVDGTVNAIAIGIDGTVYIAGEFTNEGTRITSWTGSAFTDPFGAGSASPIRTLAIAPDGDLFIGGDFTAFSGVTTARIAEWDVSAASAAKVGGNGQLNAECRALVFGKDGTLFAGGDFTTASGNTVNRIAEWRGSDWLPMASGVDNDVHSLAYIEDLLWLGGIFDNTGATPALSMPRIGIWNGSTFVRADIDLPTAPTVSAFAGSNKDVYLGHGTSGSSTAGVKTSVTNNGSASAYPIVVFTGPGTLKWLENFTSGDRLYFDLEAQAGEEITIDFLPQNKSITSNWRTGALQPLRGSDFGSFRLLPGANDIIAYITGSDGNTEIHMRWQPTHWSRDGAGS